MEPIRANPEDEVAFIARDTRDYYSARPNRDNETHRLQIYRDGSNVPEVVESTVIDIDTEQTESGFTVWEVIKDHKGAGVAAATVVASGVALAVMVVRRRHNQ